MRLLAASLAVAVLAGAPAAGAPKVFFPRDHYGHSAGIEWWYFTAYVRGSDGHRYSVFFTLFKRLNYLLPVSQVVNLDNGRIIKHTEKLIPGTINSKSVRFISPAASFRYAADRDTWIAAVTAPGYTLDFAAQPEKPYVLNGGGSGVIHQATSTSWYYSATRMTAGGVIRTGGKSVRFSGTAWFDHQWGNFSSDPSAMHWDWFSCRFDDRTELMLYRFRDGRTNGTYVDDAGHATAVSGFEAVPGPRILKKTTRRWPIDWTLQVPTLQLNLILRAFTANQFVHGTLLPTFWEGATSASGTKTGICFVEETS